MSSSAAIRTAADVLNPGDIILIELHRPGPRFNYTSRADQRGYIPIEWWPDNYDAIRYAVGRGVIVVEAAGNGGENMDDAIYGAPSQGFPAAWANPFARGARIRERSSSVPAPRRRAPTAGTTDPIDRASTSRTLARR